ncbi:hypothetical protein PO909_003802 [Leuciscus waleckii]
MILTGLAFLMLTAAVDTQEIATTDTGAILTCSGGEDLQVKWKEEKVDVNTEMEEKHKYTVKDKKKKGVVEGEFSCEYTPQDSATVTHLFYLNVKVCENCYEFSGLVASAVIFGDLLFTGAVILIIYMCARKKTGSTQQKASKPRTASAPPVPNPDYERLNQHTLSSGLYAGLK